jgi:hypothetical protein
MMHVEDDETEKKGGNLNHKYVALEFSISNQDENTRRAHPEKSD